MGAAPESRAHLSAGDASDCAANYARALLAEHGLRPLRPLQTVHEHPAIAWARSGAMALTGAADGEPQLCPVALASCADGALAALAALAPEAAFKNVHGAQLLGERAAIAGLRRAGSVSPGGACHLLQSVDGGIALNLAREDDWALLPAWLETEVSADWNAVAEIVRHKSANELVERGRVLGLAACSNELVFPLPLGEGPRVRASATLIPKREGRKPLVIDLSSLWAGPLCGHLLQCMGAEVIKVESTQRPDGARRGPPTFFDLLNAGKRSVALDLAGTQGRQQLLALLRRADIVIESSRPRALRQMGIDSERLLRERPGLSWLGITGYGRDATRENWIAYGDDAGVAAGLSALLFEVTGQRLICADAIADPLTGLHAALAVWATHLRGGGRVDVSLVDSVRRCIAFAPPDAASGWRGRHAEWSRILRESGEPVAAPRARTPAASAQPLGADTAALLREFAIAC